MSMDTSMTTNKSYYNFCIWYKTNYIKFDLTHNKKESKKFQTKIDPAKLKEK